MNPAIERTLDLSDVATSDTPPLDRTLDAPPVVAEKIDGADAAGTRSVAPTMADDGYLPTRRVHHIGQPESDDGRPVDYRLVGQLGRGGTAIIYQAHHRGVDREVALKYLRPELNDQPRARRRFLDEARVIGSLDHPGVIAIHELARDDATGGLFYAMKRVDGAAWSERIDELSLDENLDILIRVTETIRYAHDRRLLHRDLKPENVMLGRFGETLLNDWGLSIRLERLSDAPEAGSGDVAGAAVGTPAYMAPEQAAGDTASLDFRTDIYLLGATLYRIVAGHPPHHGETLSDCLAAASDNLIRPPRPAPGGTDAETRDEWLTIARRAMNTRPADRHADAAAFLEAVRDQRRHVQSLRLSRRARRRWDDPDVPRAERLPVARALAVEALELWPDNPMANELRREIDDASHRLERRVNRYGTLFSSSPDAGLLVRMPEGEVVDCNDAFADLFAMSRDDVVGRRVGELNLWVCPRRRLAMLRAVRDRGGVDGFETQLARSDGSPVDVEMSARGIDLDGQPMVVATIRDVTRRKAAERELRRSRQRLLELRKMAGLATWSYDATEDRLTWSDELYRMMGIDPETTTPSREQFYELVHPDDRARLAETVQHAIDHQTAYEISIRQRGTDGGYHPVLIRGVAVVDDSGEFRELYGVSMPQDDVPGD